MKTVRIGFSKPKGKFPILSWIIRALEQTPFSHIYIEFHSKTFNRYLIYHASGTMVHFIGRELFNKKAQTVSHFDLEISDEDYKRAIQFAIDNAAKPYGVLQLFGIGWVILGRLLGKRLINPFTDGSYSYVCSELVVSTLPELREKFKDQLDTVTPKEAWEFLNKRASKLATH